MIDIILLLSGFLAGFVNAIASGGVMFVFAALLYSGLNPLLAATTSSATLWPGVFTSAYGYRKDIRKARKHYMLLIIPAIIGTLLGSLLLIHTPSDIFEKIVPWLVLTSVLLYAFQPQLHSHLHLPSHKRAKSPKTILYSAVFIISFYAGYFGVGAGFILLAVLGFTHLKNINQINGLKNLIAGFMVLTCTILYISFGKVEWGYVLAPMLGGVLGGYVGAKVGHKMSRHLTRVVVITAGLCLCGFLIYNALQAA